MSVFSNHTCIPSKSKVFNYFQEICAIPHGSGNMDTISQYCFDFACNHNLDVIKDSQNNIIIKKPASTGYENHPVVILQGHMDMVCEKDPQIDFDFLHDPLVLEVDGDWLKAKGTTLGGDDGFAIALILAILEDNTLSHPPIEALFTTDEETGMYGAEALDGSLLSGRMLINLDSEEEGIFTVSCAGGARCDITMPLKQEASTEEYHYLTLSGLQGGHSGTEIHKGRYNANKLMGEFLSSIPFPFRIASWEGGTKDNAIPRETQALIWVKEDISSLLNDFLLSHQNENDPSLFMTLSPKAVYPKKSFNAASSLRASQLISALPSGVIAMSQDIPGLVETSLNLGILSCDDQSIHASFSVRSSVNQEKVKLLGKLAHIAAFFGGNAQERSHYPAWEYKKDSTLRPIMEEEYRKIFGTSPTTIAIHAGLECGLLSQKLPGLDAVSLGPNMQDIHTTRECLSISSVERMESYIKALLSSL